MPEFNRETAPYRERAEIFALHPQTKQIYGGQWHNDSKFAIPGGGIDDGEDVLQGALREFYEETGLRARNPRLASDAPPIVNEWSDSFRRQAPADRQHFRGTRTHSVYADLDTDQGDPPTVNDWSASNRRFYSLPEALDMMKTPGPPMAPAVYANRLRILESLARQLATPPQKKLASWLPSALARWLGL